MCADDMLERCDLARESNSERELAQTESPVDFPCKLNSERLKRKRQLFASYLSQRASARQSYTKRHSLYSRVKEMPFFCNITFPLCALFVKCVVQARASCARNKSLNQIANHEDNQGCGGS